MWKRRRRHAEGRLLAGAGQWSQNTIFRIFRSRFSNTVSNFDIIVIIVISAKDGLIKGAIILTKDDSKQSRKEGRIQGPYQAT